MSDRYLLFRAAARLHALPVGSVLEIMRPLPVDSVDDAPPFVLGVAMVRGRATPVLSGAALLSGTRVGLAAGRWIHLRAHPTRSVALAVEDVLAVRGAGELALEECAPLLVDSDAGMIEQFGRLDGELLRQLRAGIRLPEVAQV